MTTIIGICGFIGSGKDTAADYLVNFHGFRRDSFAATLKDAVGAVFGWDRELLEGRTKEARAWTIRQGWKAPQAAGVIHSDFERGFIRAEVIKIPDYDKYKTEAGCREAGKLAIEGKEYVVEDGDVMHFRFNV